MTIKEELKNIIKECQTTTGMVNREILSEEILKAGFEKRESMRHLTEPLFETLVNNHMAIEVYALKERNDEELKKALEKQANLLRIIGPRLNRIKDVLRGVI